MPDAVTEVPEATAGLPPELGYVVLLFALFVLPRVLQRWRVPAAITALGLGAAAGMGLGLFGHDPTIELLSTFGIVALFLFAGLDADVDALRPESRVLVQHVAMGLVTLLLAAWAAAEVLGLDARAAALVALALLTPSTGFILDSIARLPVTERQRFWIKSKAIATELVALAVLFVTLQSTTATRLGLSGLALAAMIALLPLVFRAFAAVVVPHAPKSEFAFLVILAVVCAFVTRELGVYYLVGAFVVGMAAQRFRERLPAMGSEKMLHAVEAFASLFVPFYFFHAGAELRAEALTIEALLVGLGFVVVALPLRVGLTALHRRIKLREPLRETLRVSVPLLPTLVFTLVIAGILRDRFGVDRSIFGGLVVYTIVNTMIPGLVLGAPTPEYDEPHARPVEDEPVA